jgi:hypothetical protein
MRISLLLTCLSIYPSLGLRAAWAQEADSGFEVRTTLSEEGVYAQELTQPPRSGDPYAGGFRALFYPVWKWNQHWTVEGAVQVYSRPYFWEQFSTQGYGVKADVLQAHLNYSRFWSKASLVVRAGILSSAFGSFLLRYDDAVNPLIDMPMIYGYYTGVTNLGLAGAQVDATVGKVDFRSQFVNSSAVNRRSIFDHDQYGNWAGGAGYTIVQGFRVGASAFRGPYLDRQSPFYFPGEADPKDLPGSGVGVDVAWARGGWNVYGEWQRLQMDYTVIPAFREQAAYAEIRRVLSPRWYVAARPGYLRASAFPGYQEYETVVGYRPNAHQLVKVEYEIAQGPRIRGTLSNTFAIQLVTQFRAISLAH